MLLEISLCASTENEKYVVAYRKNTIGWRYSIDSMPVVVVVRKKTLLVNAFRNSSHICGASVIAPGPLATVLILLIDGQKSFLDSYR